MKVKNIIASAVAPLIITFANFSHANTNPVHTWHTIQSGNGVWDAKLQMLTGNGSFVSHDGKPMNNFSVSTAQSQEYGFVLGAYSDFNVAYTLTLISREPMDLKNVNFKSKACVFVLTATGPAKPDIRANSFNGAVCNWEIDPGRGENFYVA